MRLAISCRLDDENERDFVRCMADSDLLDETELFVITDSHQYEPVDELKQRQIYHTRPAWPYYIAINPFHPSNRLEYRRALDRLDVDILLSCGVSDLRFMGTVVDFTPTILLPMGGELQRYTTQWMSGPRGWLYWQMYRYQFRRALRRYDSIWTNGVNEPAFREVGYQNHFGDVDWDPVDSDQFRSRDDAIQYGEPGDTVIGTFRRQRGTRLIPSYESFLDAVGVLATTRDDFHVVLGGYFPDGSRGGNVGNVIERKIDEHDLEEHITRVEMVPKEELPRHYSGLDVYINPTHVNAPLGGMGKCTKEAMACECAYVSFDDPPMRWAIDEGETGFVVDHDEVQKLSDILATLCDDSGLHNDIGRNARQHIVERSSREAVAERVYQNCKHAIER